MFPPIASSANFAYLTVMPERRKIWHRMMTASLSLKWGNNYILLKKRLESHPDSPVTLLNVTCY